VHFELFWFFGYNLRRIFGFVKIKKDKLFIGNNFMTIKSRSKKNTNKKSRSCAYPVLALPKAVELAKKLFDNFGAGPHSRANVARGLGYSSFSGAVSAKIGRAHV
jgi:hypothetical protein